MLGNPPAHPMYGDHHPDDPRSASRISGIHLGRMRSSPARFLAAARRRSSAPRWRAVFSGGQVYFGRAVFSGSKVDFGLAAFSGSLLRFSHAIFVSGEIDFCPTLGWSVPPTFDFGGSPPPWVSLPAGPQPDGHDSTAGAESGGS
jgi:hypothetical protein